MSEMLLLLRDVLRVDDADQESRLDDGLVRRIACEDIFDAALKADSAARDEAFRKAHSVNLRKNARLPWTWNEPLTRSKPLEKRDPEKFAERHAARLQQVTERLGKLFGAGTQVAMIVDGRTAGTILHICANDECKTHRQFSLRNLATGARRVQKTCARNSCSEGLSVSDFVSRSAEASCRGYHTWQVIC